MTWRGRWWLIAVLLGAGSAHASTVLVDGFDAVDTGGVKPICEDGTCAGIWSEHLGGTAVTTDLDLCQQSASCVTHASINGGSGTSKHSLKLNIASGETAYYDLGSAVTLNESQYADHVCVYVNTATISAATRIHEHREGANLGCYVQLNADKTLTVKDGTGNTFGSTSKVMETSYCSSSSNDCTTDQDCLDANKGDVCVSSKCQNIRTPCHDNTPCPTGQTCTACTTSTGADCYFGCHELITTTFGSTRLCELAWDGTVLVTGSPQTATTGNVTNVRIGATTDPGANGLTAYFDDYVGVGGTDRTHMSLVERTCPDEDGTPLTWTRDTCGGAGTHEQCIDDYCTGTFELGSGFLRLSSVGQQESFKGTGAMTLDDGTSVGAVEQEIVGRQTGTSAFDFSTWLLLYNGSTYTDTLPIIAVSGTGSTTTRMLARGVYDETGIAGQQNWSQGRINQIGSRWANTTGNATANRVYANLVNVQVKRSDAPSPITLCQNDGDTSDIEDHNYGTNDGKCVVAAIGDSTAYGTLAVQCQNSTSQEMCSQADYCSFDSIAAGGNQDLPAGGCHNSDAACQTCASRRADFNGGAGLPCGPNNGSVSCDQCGTSTDDAVTAGCCSGGICNGSEGISCTSDADCVLGDCSTCTDGDCTAQTPTATCELACPGSGTACTSDSQCSGGQKCNTDWGICTGTCPTGRASWPAYLPQVVSADVILQCGQGTETLPGMVQSRLASIMQTGQNASTSATGPCIAVQGSGQCECSAGSDCGTGGACTNGRCTSGDASRTACTQQTDCATSKRCLFYPPDYIIVHEGYNDFYQFNGGSANCTGPQSLTNQTTGGPCGNCPVTRCIANSTCTSRSASSECGGHAYGFGFTGTDYPCDTNRVTIFTSSSLCLLRSNACKTASDCEVSGQTCSGYTSGPTANGWCDCGADDADPATNCPSGYSCKNGRCRLACTVDANCGTGGSCAANVCQGICTCPSNSNDQTHFPNAAACTKDADCPNFGICSGGACICGGAPICFEQGDACRIPALRRWNSSDALFAGLGETAGSPPAGMDHLPHWVREAQKIVDLPPDSDGRPVLIFSALVASDLERPVCSEGDKPTGLRPVWLYHTFRKQLASMLTFPHYIDSFLTFANNPTDDLFVDTVHPGATGAQLLGQTSIGAFLNSLNVCAQNGGTERATAQPYCKTTAGVFQSTTCTTVADCSAGQLCERRPCSAAGDCPNSTDKCNLESGAL